MKITVNRFTSDSDTTISMISIDGQFECFGCEDEYRDFKIAGETRIPAGVYDVGVRRVGGFHGRYLKKFGTVFHQGMLHILNVPGFDYILIHAGNTADDTAGCLLVGSGCQTSQGDMSIQSSVNAYKSLYSKVIAAAWSDDLTIEFVDSDRIIKN